MIQTAEGALNETHSILQRMRELAVQASNDTNTESDRGEIQKEINQLTSEINRIGNTTEFNTQKLLNGSKDSTTTGNAAMIEFDLSGMTGGSISALGITETWDTDIATTAGNLKSSIEADADLSAKYTVTVSTNKITIETKTNTVDESLSADLSSATGITDDTVTTTEGKEDGAGLQFQIGANENQSLTLEISDMRANALGLTGSGAGFTSETNVTNGTDATAVESALDVSTHDSAANAITVIQQAIDNVSAERSKLGATQNRLDHTINNLGTSAENLTAAESRIRDVDMAKEMMQQTKASILAQASQAMLAQSNQMPQGVLQLLR